MRLSIISPVYQAGNIVDELVRRIISSVSIITDDFEIILVDDGSQDNSWGKIAENCAADSRVSGIKLSRNFGQHYAITAGIARAAGDNIVLMDCDLQDDPSLISVLLVEREKGFDIVFTKRVDRKHGFVKGFNAFFYNKIFDLFSDKKYDIDAGSLIMFSSQVAKVFMQLKDKDRLYLQMLKWVGFNTTTINVVHHPRFEGKSGYSFTKLLKIGLQGLTSHSSKLLRYSAYLGLILALLSFVAVLIILVGYFRNGALPGWPSIIISILGSTGLILLSIGIAGIYIGKIFEQVKDRPLFIIEKEINTHDK